jgi:hypothetical protein
MWLPGERPCRVFCCGGGEGNEVGNATQGKPALSMHEMPCMKRIWFPVLLVFVFSCKKDSELQTLKKEIAGSWEIESYSGYPFTQPSYPQGNGQVIVIGEGGSFERWKHDSLVFTGHYFMMRKKDCYEGENEVVFLTGESSGDRYGYINIRSGKLTLSTPNCYADGGTVYYRRIK